MPKPLVIVESPAKARTIAGYLGADYVVESSVGHIRDLPSNASEVPKKFKGTDAGRLGIDVENHFQPIYVVPKKKKDVVKELKDAVKDVRPSERLTDSPVCLIADEGDMDMHLERLLKQHRQIDMASKRVLEINAGHSLIRSLAERLESKGASGGKDANSALDDAAWLLLDQARILEGEALPDPAAFAKRLSAVVERGFRV